MAKLRWGFRMRRGEHWEDLWQLLFQMAAGTDFVRGSGFV